MPIEVRELIIKATITQDGNQGNSAGAANSGAAQGNEQLIKTCIEKVLEIIKEKNGR
jgi:hypothetical protein